MLSGDRLKFLRYTHEKTQAQIADWCNVSTRYVGMVESGEEIPIKQVYGAWLNCCYGVGKPLPKTPKANAKKKTIEK